jgi:hypothetical protein
MVPNLHPFVLKHERSFHTACRLERSAIGEEHARVIAGPIDPISGDEIETVPTGPPRDPKIIQIYMEINGIGVLPPAR